MAHAVNKLGEHVQILIGKDGSGGLYTLQHIKELFEDMVKNDNLREFEKKHKMFIDNDWTFYWQY